MRSILLSLLLLAPLSATAQSKFFRSTEEARRAAESVTAAVAAGDTSGALKSLRQFSSIPGRDFTAFENQILSESQRLRERYGDIIGHELVREEQAGASLLRLTYLIRHEWAGQRWMFIFYRGKEGWAVTDFTIDASLGSVFAP